MRKPGNKGIQVNYYKEGKNTGRLFSPIKNSGRTLSGITTDKKISVNLY
jgi:hypothetical protein